MCVCVCVRVCMPSVLQIVLVSIAEHHTRVRNGGAVGPRDARVLGVLFGTQSGVDIHVADSYELVMNDVGGIDLDFLRRKRELSGFLRGVLGECGCDSHIAWNVLPATQLPKCFRRTKSLACTQPHSALRRTWRSWKWCDMVVCGCTCTCRLRTQACPCCTCVQMADFNASVFVLMNPVPGADQCLTVYVLLEVDGMRAGSESHAASQVPTRSARSCRRASPHSACPSALWHRSHRG